MRGWGGIREAQSRGEGEGLAPLLPGGERVRLPPSSRAGRRTQRIRNQGEDEEEGEKEEKEEEEAGRRAD